jgi:hypothetical protein
MDDLAGGENDKPSFKKRIVKEGAPGYGFDERHRATLRADIWISRPGGSVCRNENLTRNGLLADIAADFALLR